MQLLIQDLPHHAHEIPSESHRHLFARPESCFKVLKDEITDNIVDYTIWNKELFKLTSVIQNQQIIPTTARNLYHNKYVDVV